MATETICPNCGGVIGAEDLADPRPRCQCLGSGGMDDTEMELAAVDAPTGQKAEGAAKKVCCKCGKDVTGHRRAKDEHGYWCYDCHKADLARRGVTRKPKARCPQCGRMVLAESITSYHGHTVCAKCISEQEDLPRHQQLKFRRKIDDSEQKELEKYKIMLLGGIVVLLVLVILLNHFHVL